MTLEHFRAILRNTSSQNIAYLKTLCRGADIALGKLYEANRWIPTIERTPSYEESTELDGDRRVNKILEVTIELASGERYVGYAYFDAERWLRQDMVLDLDVSQVVAWRAPEPFNGELEL